jgi:hypothetical protein
MFVAADWYYLGEKASGMFTVSASGDPLTILPSFGIALLGISIPFLLQGSEKFRLLAPNLRVIQILIPVAVLVTASTGWLPAGEVFTPGGVWWDDYGFPLVWRVQVVRSCPPWCNLPSSEIILNPFFFVVNCLFYLAIGYTVFLAIKRVRMRAAPNPA